jgi:SET family sugar efflux transporter-like MFS transporter
LRLSESLDPFRVRAFSIASLAILLAILAEAMAGSYMALLAVERARMNPIELSVFLTLSAISAIGTTAWFGRMHDEKPRLWPLVCCLVAGPLGYGLCAIVTTPWMLMVIAFLLLGASNTAYALLFAIAKNHLDGRGAATASRGMAALRMISSLSWAIGPAVGAGLVGLWSYPGVFAGAAACGAVALAGVFAGGLKPVPLKAGDENVVSGIDWGSIWPAALALTLFNTAMFMGSNALSIVTVTTLSGDETDVGLLFSLCAAIEVVVMGAFVVWPAHRGNRFVLLAGFAVFAAYFLSVIVLPSLATLYWAQILRAVAIGVVNVVGMLHIQERMPRQAGGAAALFGNTVNAGLLIAGVGTGTWAEAYGYWSIFGLCAALSIAGAALFLMPVSRSRQRSAAAR